MNQTESWKPLYRTGAIAAILAALLFRRNIRAEVSLFTGVEAIPTTIADWYALLQSNPFVGLSLLAFFDLLNYALVGVIFLALGAAILVGEQERQHAVLPVWACSRSTRLAVKSTSA